MFHQDNDPAHKSMVAVSIVNDCEFKLTDHLPYFPDLTPSDYFLFPNIKNICLETGIKLIMTSFLL